jgi:hypothetical protein
LMRDRSPAVGKAKVNNGPIGTATAVPIA